MEPKLRIAHLPTKLQHRLRGISYSTVIIICAILAMIGSLVFRWRVFTAGSKYAIFLLLLLCFLIWVGRFTRKR